MFNDDRFGLTADRLREIVHYDPRTGVFTWLAPGIVRGAHKRVIGGIAGELKPSGYVLICVAGHRYRAHRLAVLYMTGSWPEGQVDHKDTIRNHNWWGNLRPATDQQNQANSVISKDNKSGFKGVYWSKQRQKWHAKINPGRRQVHLGFFEDINDAAAAYDAGARLYFGEYARTA